GTYAEIRIADFGKGIPDEVKPRIFEEGFTYGEKASTGLGLYIVKRLVERYSGEIKVEDNKPKGTVFVIRLRAVEK
ncbi:MAG: ATP-binding protein, partial [Archaeoglobaceae archaeon]